MKDKLLTFVVIISVLVISQDIFAQETIIRKRDRNQMQFDRQLNLSIEQQEKIDVLKINHQKEMIDLKANLERKKLEMAELRNKGNYTREEFLNKTNEIISARNKIAIAKANHQMDIYQILDENQKRIWNKFPANFNERREKRMIRMMKHFNTD